MINKEIWEKYERWEKAFEHDTNAIDELTELAKNPNELFDRFHCELSFGTGGIRGHMELGSNRMNVIVVRRLAQGIANYIQSQKYEPTVVIAYDTRRNSLTFAKSIAEVMVANNVKVVFFNEPVPTPLLSYATRILDTSFGFMITASHNPAIDNGVKVYNSTGCQLLPDEADIITQEFIRCDPFNDVKKTDYDEIINTTAFSFVSEEIVKQFINIATSNTLFASCEALSSLRMVYTPLNGTGRDFILNCLSKLGIDTITVPLQMPQDGEFATCPKPNPEEKETWKEALYVAEENDAQLVIATDPDCDRIGVAERMKDGTIYYFTGNEIGILLLDELLSYYLELGKLHSNPIIIKTIVTTPMTYEIAKDYNADVIDVLNGFKFIAGQIEQLEKKGQLERFVLGFEESMGYLANTYVRDKDAVSICVLIACLAARLYNEDSSLFMQIEALRKKYGYYISQLISYEYSSGNGKKRVEDLMSSLYELNNLQFKENKLKFHANYRDSIKTNLETQEKSVINLPKADIVTLTFESNSEITFRISGTESKIKMFLSTIGNSEIEANLEMDMCKQLVHTLLQQYNII